MRVVPLIALVTLLTSGCGPSEQQVEAVRTQITAKLDLAQSELQRLGRQIDDRLTRRAESPTCDGLVRDMGALKADADLSSRRIKTQLDDLQGFLAQNEGYARRIDFGGVRRSLGEMRRRVGQVTDLIGRASDGVRDVRVSAKADSGDWDATGLTMNVGDLLAFEASGSWSVGAWVGACGPGGMEGLANYSLDSSYPHACLLVRVGETLVAAGSKSRLVGGEPTGAVTLRCNDKKAHDNHGAISVRLVLAPLSILREAAQD